LINELQLARHWRQPTHANPKEVRVFAVVLQPFGNLTLIGQGTLTRVDRTDIPAILLRSVRRAVEPAGIPGGVAEQEDHRLAIGEATFGHFEDPIGNGAGL